MQETHNNCFGLKICSTTLCQAETEKHELHCCYVVVTFRYSCLSFFAWRKVVLHFFNPKQLCRVSCLLWCYFLKWFSIILQNASYGAPFSYYHFCFVAFIKHNCFQIVYSIFPFQYHILLKSLEYIKCFC